jgi:hypothetical protein
MIEKSCDLYLGKFCLILRLRKDFSKELMSQRSQIILVEDKKEFVRKG